MYKEIEGNLLDLMETNQYTLVLHCDYSLPKGVDKRVMSKSLEETYNTHVGSSASFYEFPVQRFGCIYIKELLKERLLPGSMSTYTHVKWMRVVTLYTAISNNEDFFAYNTAFDYDAFRVCLRKVKTRITMMDKLLIPTLGCGTQGANWNLVRDITKAELNDIDITVVFKPIKNANTEQSKTFETSTKIN